MARHVVSLLHILGLSCDQKMGHKRLHLFVELVLRIGSEGIDDGLSLPLYLLMLLLLSVAQITLELGKLLAE